MDLIIQRASGGSVTVTVDSNAGTASAAAAAASATAAAASATASANSATASDASATASAGSAATATTQAGIATTQAGNASASATTASTQAGIATTQANIATTQAGISTTQAGIATTQATNSANSATAAAASAVTAVNAPGTSGTSTTSLTIGVGTQTFTTQTAKAWVVGQFVTIAGAAPANAMNGYISAYNSGTGSMSVVVSTISGSGTFASWTIGLSAPIPANAVLQSDIGYAANQIPLNQYLGSMAYQSSNAVAITGGSGSFTTLNSSGDTRLGGLSGNQSLQVNNVASAVNYLQVAGAATGAAPTIIATGYDADVGLFFAMKGWNAIKFNSTTGGQLFQIGQTTGTTANYLQALGNSTGNAPTLSAQGSDPNISLALSPKGTGGITVVPTGTYVNTLQFSQGYYNTLSYIGVTGTGSFAGVQYNVTPASGGASHTFTAYGSPTLPGQNLLIVGTAPAGGTSVNYLNIVSNTTGLAPTLLAQGSDANVNLVLTGKGTGVVALGGTTAANSAAQFVPTTSSVNFLQFTGGSSPIVATAGTDANVQLTLRSKGTYNVAFQTSGGAGISDFAPSTTGFGVNFLRTTASGTGNAPELSAQGSDGNIDLLLRAKGTGVVALGGTTAASSGFVVSPVASSVNYIQAAGVATGGNPLLSTQGANTDITLRIQNKGVLSYYGAQFENSAGGVNFQICSRASSVNYFRSNPATTGNAPELSVQGSDTNINLKLVPQGTGTVQFGTYTAGVVAQAGYITITDAGGTSRRLLVG
jgi:hypothetical protein